MKYGVLLALGVMLGCTGHPIFPAVDPTAVEAQESERIVAHGAGEAYRQCIAETDSGVMSESPDPAFVVRERCNRDYDRILTCLDRANQVIARWEDSGALGRFRCLMRQVFDPLVDLRIAMGPGPKSLEEAIHQTVRAGEQAPERCDP
jgi:hypothetical protein